MIRAWLLGLLLVAGACYDNSDVGFEDMGTNMFPADPTCEEIDRCTLGCPAGSGAACTAQCQDGFDDLGIARYQALAACIDQVCNEPASDGGVSPCADPGSSECQHCRTNAQFDTPSQCTGAAPSCGACATQQAACFGS